ncbi:hypothetical protein EWM64_g10449 [Hericium alpestre]|uniref:Uncharacterized protein n=1 Tax=Hericium alpestre TaxID=135208 RepID=A0A4Y9ZIA8_9AGAM|nr:hypothetical protein EWM64_g10449 [Hericium alpestre]
MYPPLRGRSPSRKASYPHIAAPTIPPTMDPRRRRVLLPLLALAALFCFLFFSSSHELFALPPDDGDLIKAILTRLTSRSTFPNVILLGKSIGGSDQLVELHKEGKLKAVLEEAGLKVQADIKIPEAQM